MLDREIAHTLTDPALKGRWIAMFEDFDITDGFFVESISVSMLKTPPTQRFYNGYMHDFPGVASTDAISVTFYETHDFRVLTLIENWQRLIFNPDTGNYGLPVQYHKTLDLLLLGYENEIVKRVNMTPVWPADRTPFELNYSENNGRLQVQITLAVGLATLYNQ